ncbi:diaminopimelate epimerase [Phytohabitans rumicis]|uniref:Diaminopimelate epimerase n=1 Tax=Phytohabitans rumicis TaxID=1076125 RepID=A0A6V8L200_9ACTN|nr:diaminopimelate epimerase [Phytohabitans rumicis]GFJ88831.1 diaminopimelate epimerase [Phytohabitans rumicis]
MRFLKGHGTGNDFVILPDAPELTPSLVAALCDRRFGIGGDGVLRVARSSLPGVDWFMDYWNSDGSLAEMCGNGARVFARYLESAGLAAGTVPIETRAGVVRAVIGEQTISVDMGLPKVYGESTATVTGRVYEGTAVDCGNPHLVCPLPDGVSLSSLDLDRPPAYDHDFYPAGVNVEFYEPVAPAHVRMRVYERGSAETLSCGTGAVAVATVARGAASSVTVDVPGGRVQVHFPPDTVWLEGPAVLVAAGETTIAG